MTRAQFIEYYETRHAPLILSIAPQVCDYRRNFIESPKVRSSAPGARRPVTSMW